MIGWRNLRETPVTKSKSVSVLHLMSWEDGASLPCYYAVKNTDNQSTFRILLKPFPIESWTTKTKIIKPVDENGDSFSKWEFNVKPGKLRKSAGRRGWQSFHFASDWLRGLRKFLNQSHGEVKQNQIISDYFLNSIENFSTTQSYIALRYCYSHFSSFSINKGGSKKQWLLVTRINKIQMYFKEFQMS